MNEKLQPYLPIAAMIATTFGPNCEVAVHDLSQPETSVVFVSGEATGRKIGQSFDHLVKDVLLNEKYSNDQVNNYVFTTPSGQLIKSSTVFIRESGTVIGAMCVNYDITVMHLFFRDMSAFLGADENTIDKKEIEPSEDVATIVNGIIDKIMINTDTQELNRKKAVELIRFMDDKGLFLVKGTIERVAELLGVSKVTIYSYLDEARDKR